MEHAEAREIIEIAALEPGGFERLAAGDTPDAAALASHIAGCLECSAEMERLRRAAIVIRDAVRTSPPPELRARTLAFVAAVGRPRGMVEAGARTGGAPAPSAAPSIATDRGRQARGVRPGVGQWVAAIAAAVVIAVAGTTIALERLREPVIQAQATQIAALSKVAAWSLRIDGEPDAKYVQLAATSGPPDLAGTLAFSPRTKELVVLAEGLAQPPSDMQYRCWVEVDGTRRRIGQMFFAGDLAFWVGAVDELSAAPGTRFGVSLVPAGGDSLSGDPVLLGEL